MYLRELFAVVPASLMDFPGLHIDIGEAHLRVLTPTDVHQGYVDGLNDPDVNRFLVNVKTSRQTIYSVSEFVRENFDSPDAVLLGIWETGRPHHIGTIRLHHIAGDKKSAHIGICLFDKNAWGKKLGARAIRALTAWARANLGLTWIEAGIYADNQSSQRAFLSAGYDWISDIPDVFVFEGKPAVVRIYVARRADVVDAGGSVEHGQDFC